MPATAEMHELTARLQPWRPAQITDELAEIFAADGTPFCTECADWHQSADDHSTLLGAR